MNKIDADVLMEHKLADLVDVIIHTDTDEMSLGSLPVIYQYIK